MKADALHITAGVEQIARFRSSEHVERSFCKTCGSRLFFAHDLAPDLVWIAAGTFAGEDTVKPDAHIFVSARASWCPIADDLPKYDRYRPLDT